MAAKTATMLSVFEVSVKNERLLMNKLKDKGLKYVSSSGKVIAAKTQPVLFCHCPQKCKSKLPLEKWNALFQQFYDLGDQNKQNQFLQSHILIRAIHLHNWESEKPSPANKRRVTCRYHVPRLGPDCKLEDFILRRGSNSIEVCQKAFMNCFGITEKRIRMQREKCISKVDPSHYKHSTFGRKDKLTKSKQENESFTKKVIEFSNGLEITPLDLKNLKQQRFNGKESEESSSVDECFSDDTEKNLTPLDLSHSKQVPRPPSGNTIIEIDKSKLYEIAEKNGLSKERVDKEMNDKYEQLVRKNIRKHEKNMTKNQKKRSFEDSITSYNHTEIENRRPTMKAISDQVVGLEDDFTILPIQTLNNGDLTISPVLGPVSKPVENGDIMRVNSFFQNQLWKPEYIGLSSWSKLLSQSYDI